MIPSDVVRRAVEMFGLRSAAVLAGTPEDVIAAAARDELVLDAISLSWLRRAVHENWPRYEGRRRTWNRTATRRADPFAPALNRKQRGARYV